MRFEVVITERRLAEVAPAWERLWLQGPRSVFQNHGWIMAWWKARDTGEAFRLHVGLAWSGATLVAAIPCASRVRHRVRVLEWAAKDCTDYCDALLDPHCTAGEGLLEATWRAMGKAGGFDAVYLSHVRPDSVIRELTSGLQSRPVRLRPGPRAEPALQVLSNGLTGAEWFRALPKKARNNHTRGKRIVGESGPVAVTAYDAGRPENSAILEQMIVLKRQWLLATGRRSPVLEHDARILRSLVAELERQRLLRMFTITCGEMLVAASVNIAQERGMAAFFAAYDPQFDRASPGTLIMVEYLIWAFDKGVAEVDFLCGAEDYKSKFANVTTMLNTFVGARTLLGHAALAVGEHLDRRRLARQQQSVAPAFVPEPGAVETRALADA